MDKIQNVTTAPKSRARSAQPSNIPGWRYVVIASIALMALAFAAHSTPYFDFDLTIVRAVQSVHAGWFDGLMRAVGWPGYPPQVNVWAVILFLILFFYISRWAGVAYVFGAVGIVVVGSLVKILVDRPRPSPDMIQVWNASLDGGKYSFSAGHVQVYVAIFGFLLYLAFVSQKRSRVRVGVMIISGLLIALIGLARIYSGEHWFSDVVGGYLLGSVWLVLTIFFYRWGKPRFFVRAHGKVQNNAAQAI